MSRKRQSGKKVRVDFRQNRSARKRSDDWTRRYREQQDAVEDTERVESVRPKGDLSRRRTVIVDDADSPIVDESQWRKGMVTIVRGLHCIVADPNGQTWECTVRRVLRTLLIEQRSAVTVGDRVWISDQSGHHDGQPVGVIERVAPRSSELCRQDGRGRGHTIVANADQLLIVASVAQPALKPHLIDRYLVAALKGGLRPIICFNKIDLIDDERSTDIDLDELHDSMPVSRAAPENEIVRDDQADEPPSTGSVFRPSVASVITELTALGYTCIETSAATGQGLDVLRAQLSDHVTVLSGQSGVGKSSLINQVEPGLALTTGAVSRENEKGRHTTTHARLLPLSFGGYVVDTPGIRTFDLWEVGAAELEAFFEDFLPFIDRCRFNDCLHRDEAGCAVVAAMEVGDISPRRYWSYAKMFDERAGRA